MAIAKRSAGVTRGYKVKTKRAVKREPGVWQRGLVSLQQSAREIVAFTRDEIVCATIDTLRLLEYLRYEWRIGTRARAKPVVRELETFVQEHELLRDVGTFAAEQASAVKVETFKRTLC
jgi:hypothetical protein